MIMVKTQRINEMIHKKMEINFPLREEAIILLTWANGQNPGLWSDHCRVVGRTAETIAAKCGLDTERAFVSGLLHDIGYYGYHNIL